MHFHNVLRVCRSTKGFFIFAPASLFYILKFMYYDLVSELTTGNRPYCKRGFFFLPSWLPAVDLDHLSTRAPPPGTVPCSVQGISQTTIPERGSGQHAAWTGRLPVQSWLALLATSFSCSVIVTRPLVGHAVSDEGVHLHHRGIHVLLFQI